MSAFKGKADMEVAPRNVQFRLVVLRRIRLQ